MYCKDCGKLLNEEAVVCRGCGIQVKPLEKEKIETWALSTFIILLIVSVFLPIVGLVSGVVGVIKHKKTGPALALLIISVAWWMVWIAVMWA